VIIWSYSDFSLPKYLVRFLAVYQLSDVKSLSLLGKKEGSWNLLKSLDHPCIVIIVIVFLANKYTKKVRNFQLE